MIIHVVQPGETLQSIASNYETSEAKLIQDNGLISPYILVVGQSIIITYPTQTHTVIEGDTLLDIANSYNVSILQLLQNNPYLSDREFIYPGDIIVINYNKKGKIITYGNTTPIININTLRATLPYLTYLSILNYTATSEGAFITYYDDSELINITKEYGTIPLMLLTTLTLQGVANILTTFDLLLSEDFQNRQLDNILEILRTKGYSGVNISFQSITITNYPLYEAYYATIARRLQEEGYLVVVTINPDISSINSEVVFDRIDYTTMNQSANNLIFMSYEWAININPPSPISSIYNLDVFFNYMKQFIRSDNVIAGMATIGYDWELPFISGLSNIYSLTLENAVNLARNVGATIQFDEISQTPYFQYFINTNGKQIAHIVWFIDARSINSLLELISKYNLNGLSIWNITVYNPQLWMVVNSQYEIEKF